MTRISGQTETNCNCRVPNILMQAGVNAGIGAFTTWVFQIIHPVSGAIFGATYGIMNTLLRPGVEELFEEQPNGLTTKITIFVLSVLASLSIATMAAAALGFSLSFKAAVALSIAMIPMTLLVDYSFKCLGKASPKHTIF